VQNVSQIAHGYNFQNNLIISLPASGGIAWIYLVSGSGFDYNIHHSNVL